jgi:hypothetical protein
LHYNKVELVDFRRIFGGDDTADDDGEDDCFIVGDPSVVAFFFFVGEVGDVTAAGDDEPSKTSDLLLFNDDFDRFFFNGTGAAANDGQKEMRNVDKKHNTSYHHYCSPQSLPVSVLVTNEVSLWPF